MKDCIFCKIVKKEIPKEFVHEEEEIFVFKDINPKAPVHLLVVPLVHIKTFLDLKDKHFSLLTNMMKVVQRLIQQQKLKSGYRVVINGGKYQEIDHLHFHLLGD